MRIHEVECLETKKQMRDLAFRLFIDKEILNNRVKEIINESFKENKEVLKGLSSLTDWWFGLVNEKEQGVYEALCNLTNRLYHVDRQEEVAKTMLYLGSINVDYIIDKHCNVEELYNLVELNHSY